MQNRRDFLKTAAFATLGSGMVINEALAAEKKRGAWFNLNRKSGAGTQMKLRFFPYELKLRHVFTVATYSRSTTPDVQVELEYDGVIGYGEASMPPYLQKELGTLDSVMAFLKKVQDTIGRFSDPFQMEDILAYIDSLSESDAAAKAAVDIALHDLVGTLWVNSCRRPGTKYGGWIKIRLRRPPLLSASIRPTWCAKRQRSVPTVSTSSR